jgi:hypothetical protein
MKRFKKIVEDFEGDLTRSGVGIKVHQKSLKNTSDLEGLKLQSD